MATLYAGSASLSVKVRDLSSTGALVEGEGMPALGTAVSLRRGSLSVAGELVWRRNRQAGVRFSSSVDPAKWLPQRARDAAAYSLSKPGRLSALELTRLCVALESLAEDLASDHNIAERHIGKLPTLKIVTEALRKLAAER